MSGDIILMTISVKETHVTDTYLNMKELGEFDNNKPFIKKWTMKSRF